MATKNANQKGANLDFVERGTPKHASLLGIRKATQEDAIQVEGWALSDPTAFGVSATENFLTAVLRQKVNELKSTPAEIQSEDPTESGYHPVMWDPDAIARSAREVSG